MRILFLSASEALKLGRDTQLKDLDLMHRHWESGCLANLYARSAHVEVQRNR